ncbi:MAG: signal peptidase I [Candidatus Thorarchaeota archaeon]|nr:signal peptidase I [Candidatus Thorarchaeota archaeon]
METIRGKIRWNERSELAKTGFLLAIVVVGTLGGYGIFMLGMGTSSPLVVVTSESMETTLYRGDLLVLQARAPEDIHLGDIIVYLDTTWHTDGPIVHRVIEIQENNGTYYFITKGDNNSMPDPGERTYDEIVGVVVMTIPWLGNVSLFLRTTVGFATMAIIFFLILIVPEFACKDDEGEAQPETEPEVTDE